MSGYRLVIIFGLFFFVGNFTFSQDSTGQADPRITWVGRYPSDKADKSNGKKKGRLMDFFLGKKSSLMLTKPVNITVNQEGDFWILDQSVGMLHEVHQNVGDFTHIRNRKFEQFPSLVGICSYRDKKILFTDSYLNKVFVYNPEKREVHGLFDSTVFKQPTGIAYSEVNKEIWVVETALHSVTVLNEDGTSKRTIGQRGTNPGEFNFPTSIWIDKRGLVYIVDALNFRVQVFKKDGELVSVFGKNGDGGGNLARPKGIATDSYGNIYIVDALFNAVQVFDLSGRFLYSFGKQGHGNGEFWMPSGIFIDENNFIYIADSYNSRIEVFQLTN